MIDARLLSASRRRFAPIFVSALASACTRPSPPAQETPARARPVAPAGRVVSELAPNVRAIFRDRRGDLWVGGGEQGPYRYDGERLVLYTTDDGLCDAEVLAIQEDHLGNVYFDTTTCVSKFDGERFVTLEVNGEAPGEWKLEPNDLWFRMGWDGPGPFRYDGEVLHALEFPATGLEAAFRVEYPDAPASPRGVYEIYEDSHGHMWFGTAALGAARFDGVAITWLYDRTLTETPEGGSFGIRSILEDDDGDFWFCNTEQRYAIEPGSSERDGTVFMNRQVKAGAEPLAVDDASSPPYFMAMSRAPNGDLWMASLDRGVWRKSGETMSPYPTQGIQGFTIYADDQGDIWLGSLNAGLFRFDGARFEPFAP
jgi:ligand-binding sensor domain-containing protein